MTLLLQRFPSFRSPALRSTGVAAVLLLAAPPGATQSHPRGPTGSRAIDPVLENPVVTTLNAFGISTAPTPRQDELGQDLDTSYGPLGGSVVLERTDELVMVGLDLQGDDEQRQFFLYQDGTGGAPAGYYDPEILYDMGVDEMEDLRPAVANGRAPQSYRAVASGDVDGDGLEEVLVLHRAGSELRLRVIEDQLDGFTTTELLVAVESGIDDVAVAAADFDGDGEAEIALAWAVDGVGVTLAARQGASGGFAPIGGFTLVPALGASAFSLVLETGSVDNDFSSELLLVVDENADPLGLCRWFLLDDLGAGGGLLAGGPLSSTVAGTTRTAVVGDAALGDIDGDGRDEVVLAGLTAFTHGCEQPDYLVLALDDAEHGFAQLGTSHFHHDYYIGACSGGPKLVRWAHVDTGDFDGDGRDEILMNQWIYEDWVEGGSWTAAWTRPASVVLSGSSWQYFDRSTSAFAVGDYTGDGRVDVLTVRSGILNAHVYALEHFGPDPQFTHRGYIHCESYSAQWGFPNPLLLPVNVDADSPVLAYAEEHQLVFTEPIVIAALAAPPYELGIAQNYGACSTAFGNTQSTGSETERTVSLSAGVSVGVNLDGGPLTQSEFELEQSLTVEASFLSGHAYQLERTILFQSGWNEDLVVFTTLPVDVYTYTVLSHPTDPALVGQKTYLRLPRDPIVLQADRAYYNAHILEGGMRVDERVFQHALGDVSSYPSRTEKDALLALHGGLQHGPVSVGQGSGSTQVAIQVAQAWSQGGALEVSYELALRGTAFGVMGGFTVGASAASSLRVTSGWQTTYTGTVGAIGAPDFAANQYEFGLFTYVLPDPVRGYQFEVLNYWVE